MMLKVWYKLLLMPASWFNNGGAYGLVLALTMLMVALVPLV